MLCTDSLRAKNPPIFLVSFTFSMIIELPDSKCLLLILMFVNTVWNRNMSRAIKTRCGVLDLLDG